ncbi:MAG TPA: hypothetical protein PK280_17645, partial [Planctomycetota bacterium]|nr:hypothetical protein [Planctomycetota bacterium]
MTQEPGGGGGGGTAHPAPTPADVLRGLVAELRAGSSPVHSRVHLACLQGRRRIEFLEATVAEVKSWPERGLLPASDAVHLTAALAAEIGEIEGLIREAMADPKPAIPMARLVSSAPSPEPAPPTPPSAAATQPPAAATAPVPAGAAEPAAEPAIPVPAIPWYAEDKNLRILANLGILVFNVGLIGFITSAWGALRDPTKVAILTAYAGMLLAGGLALRLKTKLAVTGTAMLALAVLAVPIDFFAVHNYGLTGLSRGALGLIGSGACWLVAAAIALLVREKLFVWIAYLAGAAAVCWGCDAAGLECRHWSGPLLLLFLACLLPAWIRRRLPPRADGDAARAGLPDLLLAPAEAFAMAGATAALLLHLGFWLGAGLLDARENPAAVLAPLALGCIHFVLAAALTRAWPLLIPAAVLKPVILLAALRAAGVPSGEWPAWLMLLAAAMAMAAACASRRAGGIWTVPHLATGWVSGSIALLWALGASAVDGFRPDGSGARSSLDTLILTAAWPLVAGAAFALLRGSPAGTIMAGLLAMFETALLLRRQDAGFETAPTAYVLLAAALAVLGALAARRGEARRVQAAALPVIGDLCAAVALTCILARSGDFWAAPWARWALAALLGAALLYSGEAFLSGRRTEWPALAAAHLAIIAAARAAGLDWPWLAPVLAGAGLASAAGLLRDGRLRAPALVWGNLAALAALGLALAVCLDRPEDRWLALVAVAAAAGLHLLTAEAAELAAARFSGLLLAGTACGLLAFQLGLPGRFLWSAAAALALAYHFIGDFGRERSWKALAGAASDLAAGAAMAAALFSGLLGAAGWGVLPVLLIASVGAAIFHAIGCELRRSGGPGAAPAAWAFAWTAGL